MAANREVVSALFISGLMIVLMEMAVSGTASILTTKGSLKHRRYFYSKGHFPAVHRAAFENADPQAHRISAHTSDIDGFGTPITSQTSQ